LYLEISFFLADGLAAVMFLDGFRGLTFMEGIEDGSICGGHAALALLR